MTTAYVLSGGSSLGAVQVGMLAALEETGVRADLVVGASVGALNGAWIAGRPAGAGTSELGRVWRSLTRDTVFPLGLLRGLLGFLGARDHLVTNHGNPDRTRHKRRCCEHPGRCAPSGRLALNESISTATATVSPGPHIEHLGTAAGHRPARGHVPVFRR